MHNKLYETSSFFNPALRLLHDMLCGSMAIYVSSSVMQRLSLQTVDSMLIYPWIGDVPSRQSLLARPVAQLERKKNRFQEKEMLHINQTELSAIRHLMEEEGRPTEGLRPGPLDDVARQAVAIGAFDDEESARKFVEWALSSDGQRTIRPTSWLDRYDLVKIAHAAEWKGIPKPTPDHDCSGAYAGNLADRYVQLGTYSCVEDVFRFLEGALSERLSPDESQRIFGDPPGAEGRRGSRSHRP